MDLSALFQIRCNGKGCIFQNECKRWPYDDVELGETDKDFIWVDSTCNCKRYQSWCCDYMNGRVSKEEFYKGVAMPSSECIPETG